MKGIANGSDLYERMIEAGYKPVTPKAAPKRRAKPKRTATQKVAAQYAVAKPTPVDPAKRFSGIPYIMRRLRDEYGATTVEGVLAAWEDRYVPSLTPPGPPMEMLMAEARAAIEELCGTGDAVTA